MSQGDEIWQDGRSGWVAGHLPFGELKVTIGPVTAIGMWGYTPVLITGILLIVIWPVWFALVVTVTEIAVNGNKEIC